ncbi:MAG: nitroreductase family protein [Phycisphaerae bacterium]
MTLDAFEQIVRRRRSVRHFRPDPIPDDLLARLLDIAHWAPSGYNLQPTHFVIVRDAALRRALQPACMGQSQISEAPALVVFTGDRRVVENHFDRVITMERAAGAINDGYERTLRRIVPLAFQHGPLGLGWLWKALLAPLVRPFVPIPSLPAAEKRFWLAKQVSLAAMTFMLAADAAGLNTVPMEGFDERRVRRMLGIPRSHVVIVIVPVGYSASGELKKTRLPVTSVAHVDRW